MMAHKFVLVGITLLCGCAVGSDVSIAPENCVTSEAQSNEAVVAVARMCTLETSVNAPQNGWRWGSEYVAPKSSVVSLQIQIDGENVSVPISSFSDLGNPKNLAVRWTGESVQVQVVGGDAAVGYTAVIRILNGRVIERRVSNNEFGNVAWEKTEYSYNNLMN